MLGWETRHIDHSNKCIEPSDEHATRKMWCRSQINYRIGELEFDQHLPQKELGERRPPKSSSINITWPFVTYPYKATQNNVEQVEGPNTCFFMNISAQIDNTVCNTNNRTGGGSEHLNFFITMQPLRGGFIKYMDQVDNSSFPLPRSIQKAQARAASQYAAYLPVWRKE